MSFNRAARRAAPLLLQHSLRASRPLPSKIPAIAILIPRQFLSTETSTSTTGTAGAPPPGFNIEQAKKPLPEKRDEKSKEGSTSSQPSSGKLAEHAKIPTKEPTASPKGKAAEALSLNELATEKAATEKAEEKAAAKKKEEDKKLTIWGKVKKEAAHYWDGTKLLAAEVSISSRLALKMAAGYELTRRENRQVGKQSFATFYWY
jgi:LETM1 and EF-hand domain-containing protein 1, mitochondrial